MGHHNRSIYSQLQHVLCELQAFGQSKHAHMKKHNGWAGYGVYSIERMRNLRETAAHFAKFMKTHYPEIKQVDEILPHHVQAWLNENTLNGKSRWTRRTAYTERSNIQQLFARAKVVYPSVAIDLSKLWLPEDALPTEKRIFAFSKEDLNLLRKSFADRDSKACGRTAIELTYRAGLRVKEIERLSPERINLDDKIIEIRKGAKNGKYRDVPIRAKHMAYFSDLKERTKNKPTVTGASAKSINDSIRAEMKRVGISEKYPCTGIHAIRKLYAIERLKEELDKVYKSHPYIDREEAIQLAWPKVQKELGHGESNRRELYRAYIERPIESDTDEDIL